MHALYKRQGFSYRFPFDSMFLSNASHDVFGALGHMAGLLHTSAQIIE